MTAPRQSPLHEIHVARGGRIVEFAGWLLPVQFSGIIEEHRAVRERAGLFDVSHMGEVRIHGPQAKAAVQFLITNDIEPLRPGRALYTVMCNEQGGVIDDLIVYGESSTSFFLCINAARIAVDVAHMRNTLAGFDCAIENLSDDYAQLALQGPKSLQILHELSHELSGEAAQLAPFSWMDVDIRGVPVRVARTGYTGEAGVELYCPKAAAPKLWTHIEDAGAASGLALCGLGARDTLRLEMKYVLYGVDMTETNHPFEMGLSWVVKLAKTDFCGRTALLKLKSGGYPNTWVGFVMNERAIARHDYAITVNGATVGRVTSGTHSPTLGVGIGAGFVPKALAAVGTSIAVDIRGRSAAARVVKTPFVRREAG